MLPLSESQEVDTFDRGVQGQRVPATAELVIEVAVGDPALDRENAALYAEASVKEYWIVLGKERQIELFRRLDHGRDADRFIAGPDGALQGLAFPTFTLNIPQLLGE